MPQRMRPLYFISFSGDPYGATCCSQVSRLRVLRSTTHKARRGEYLNFPRSYRISSFNQPSIPQPAYKPFQTPTEKTLFGSRSESSGTSFMSGTFFGGQPGASQGGSTQSGPFAAQAAKHAGRQTQGGPEMPSTRPFQPNKKVSIRLLSFIIAILL
jgi:hypothetical protein